MNNLELAIKMELDGEAYYTEQAKINKDNSLNKVFLMLAEDERYHAEILQRKLNKSAFELKANNTVQESKSIFEGIGDFKSEITENPNQLDVYRMALEKEKQSIELYTILLSEATDDKDKELFEYLIEQEKNHFSVLEELVLLLNRTNDWVEDAEFGIRMEEY